MLTVKDIEETLNTEIVIASEANTKRRSKRLTFNPATSIYTATYNQQLEFTTMLKSEASEKYNRL